MLCNFSLQNSDENLLEFKSLSWENWSTKNNIKYTKPDLIHNGKSILSTLKHNYDKQNSYMKMM